jgi:hypothetical protein
LFYSSRIKSKSSSFFLVSFSYTNNCIKGKMFD